MKSRKIMIVLAVFMSSALLLAQGTPKLELSISESKVNMTAEERTEQQPVSYGPGDIIHYVITAENSGDALMTEPQVTDPIPPGVVYVPLSARGEETLIRFSINNGLNYQAWPPTYTVRDEEGREIVKIAPPEMVTHIRWDLLTDLEPGEKKELEFEVKVK
jgi:uncharacterized repeat protein (TIGR01451 family)